MEKLKRGDRVKCISAMDEGKLTIDKVYIVVRDEEPGIFPDRPFVTVEGEFGPLCCHASRFTDIL